MKINNNFTLGASYLFLEIVCSLIIAIIIKIVTEEIPVSLALCARYCLSLPLLIAFGLHQRGLKILKINNISILLIRVISGFLGLIFWFFAVSSIEISKATALLQTMVLFITILAAIILREPFSIKHILIVFCGLIGTLILINPGTNGWFSIGIIYGLAAPFFSALMFVSLRRLAKSEVPITTALWYNIFGSIATGIWCTITIDIDFLFTKIGLLLIICGVIASFQQLFMALSHKFASASSLAPINYIAVPMSVLIGYLFFNETLTFHFFLGALIIIVANYSTILIDNKNKISKVR